MRLLDNLIKKKKILKLQEYIYKKHGSMKSHLWFFCVTKVLSKCICQNVFLFVHLPIIYRHALKLFSSIHFPPVINFVKSCNFFLVALNNKFFYSLQYFSPPGAPPP